MTTADVAEAVMAVPGRKLGGVTVPVPPSVWVACTVTDCRRFGQQHQIWLRRVGVGVVEIPRLRCEACSCELLIAWGEDEMPKITVHGGPSHVDDPPKPKLATGGVVKLPYIPGENGPDPLVVPLSDGDSPLTETPEAVVTDAAERAKKSAPRKAGGRKP